MVVDDDEWLDGILIDEDINNRYDDDYQQLLQLEEE